MDREDRDRLETFRRKLLGEATDVHALPAAGVALDDAGGIAALVAAQGKVVAMVAMLLDRERILKAEELGNMLATIASVTAEHNPAEGEILAIWAAGVHDVASGL